MKNKTKIELFTATECCSQNATEACSQESNQCDCEVAVYSTDTDPGKARAKELGVESYPAIAINDQVLTCEPIANAISAALASMKSSSSCCC